MKQQAHSEKLARARKRRRRTLAWTAIIFALLLAGAAGSAFWLKGRELVAPDWLRDQIAVQLERVLPEARIDFGDVVAIVDEDWRPRFSIRDLQVQTLTGDEIITVSDARAGFDKLALFEGRLALSSLEARGVFVTMRRSAEGAIELSVGMRSGSVTRQAPTLAELVSDMDEFLLRPSMEALRRVDLRAITLRYEDLRAGRVWTIDGGRMRLDRDGEALQLAVDLAVLGGVSGVATLEANYAGTIGEPASSFGVTIANIDARDIASQGAAFSWLAALQAPISGALRGGMKADGSFEPVNATFQIGAGVIQPTPEASPIPIDGARSYFSYLPDQQLLRFDEFSIESKWGRGQLTGQAVLGTGDGGRIKDLVGQLRLSSLSVNPDGLYPAPVDIAAAELDFRLNLAPFVLEVGRLQVSDLGQTLTAQGRITAGRQGWDIAMDGQMDGLAAPRLVALWPERLKPKTRRWIGENVRDGRIMDATAAVRIAQGSRPRVYLGFDFEDAAFTFTRHMPPMRAARGHASLVKDRFVMVFDEGVVEAPEGGIVDASGTSFIVPDTTAKPDPPGIVRLVAEGSVTAALSLLDRPPLEVMRKAGIPVNVAEGRLSVEGTLSLPLKKKPEVDEVTYDVTGTVLDVSSDLLVKDRLIAAPRLALFASQDEVRVVGAGTLDGVPLQVVWRQQLGKPGERLPGRVIGEVEITPAALEAFGISLPPGTLSGAGLGKLSLDMLKGTPPTLEISSDLRGIELSLPPIGWSKPAGRAGRLDVAMTLGDAARVDLLKLEAPGLYASGSVDLTESRKLDRVRFEEVRVGDWLDVPVDLVARGEGAPVGVVVRGGTVDLRRADLPASGRSRADSGPLTVRLDRLRVSDTISITDLTGDFSTTGGLAGDFQGTVNGVAPVSGRLTPQDGRSAVRVQARDAGRLLAAAGFSQKARAGRMDLLLVPVGTGGAFDGKLKVEDIRVTNAPAMAALLNSISVVGLINELNGEGIFFSDMDADFRLTPSRITVREASAVGASMGLSMDGVFEPDTGALQIQGVISPVYMLNSIGSVFSRPGEGLFGFNYSITGTVDAPEVFVNPLTALAPGALRNLFRGAQPDVPLEEGEPEPVSEPRRAPVVTHGEDR